MKYFFLSDGWSVGRVWELGGLWSASREPEISRLGLCLVEGGETLWLYRAEEAVLMLEVRPPAVGTDGAIGQVVLKRLIDADRALEILAAAARTDARDGSAIVAPAPEMAAMSATR